MKLKRSLFVVMLGLTIVAGGTWINGSVASDATAWSSADLYQQAHKNHRSTADWTFKAFH